jgi:hypothetical protein
MVKFKGLTEHVDENKMKKNNYLGDFPIFLRFTPENIKK